MVLTGLQPGGRVTMAVKEQEQRPGDPDLRRTGILPIGLIPWGAHICMFYDEPEDLIDTHADFFGAGLADNECCVWALSDSIDRDRAAAHLRHVIAGFDDYLAAGAIELIPAREWYLRDDKLDPKRVTKEWLGKLNAALARDFAGLRVSGNAFWMQTDLWETFRAYEEDIDDSFAGTRMIALCTYPLRDTGAADLLDVARAHQVSVARRKGKWEILESSELAATRREVHWPGDAAEFLSRPFPGRDLLTPRERATLAEIVRGASNKEAARALDISPRTIEFHRTNIMRKLKVRNVAELFGLVLGTA
jgi:DNA-binding CsgD family transcriptional regulator